MSHTNKQYPEPIVGAFITDRKLRVLLVLSHKWASGVWTVPGGHIELGERIADAAVRETKEEVGLDVSFHGVFAVQEAVFPKEFSRRKHFIFLECDLRLDTAEPRIDRDEIQQAVWFTFKDAYTRNLEENTRKSLELLEVKISSECL